MKERPKILLISSLIPHPSSLKKRRPRMALTAQQLDQQKKQAEELLFSGPQTLGFAKGLFFGHFNAPLVFPYPRLPADQQASVDAAIAEVRQFAHEHINAAAIDQNADI